MYFNYLRYLDNNFPLFKNKNIFQISTKICTTTLSPAPITTCRTEFPLAQFIAQFSLTQFIHCLLRKKQIIIIFFSNKRSHTQAFNRAHLRMLNELHDYRLPHNALSACQISHLTICN